ncbi:hypothetical protein PENTCL1PPCAC_790, partial [Pristionchus entomophagus]
LQEAEKGTRPNRLGRFASREIYFFLFAVNRPTVAHSRRSSIFSARLACSTASSVARCASSSSSIFTIFTTG